MKERGARRDVVVLLAIPLLVGLLSASLAAQVTDEQIVTSIERGVQHLLDTQTDQGLWSPDAETRIYSHSYVGPNEVCAMLALAYAGVSMNEPKMQKGFDALLKLEMRHTYVCALRIMVISKLLPKLRREQAARARQVMKTDAAFLVDTQRDNGAWGYPRYEADSDPPKIIRADTWWDFSNTQIAILGLSEASKAGLEIPAAVYKKTQDLYLKEQFEDGGWDYGHEFGSRNAHRDSPYGSMSAAAVASLFLTRDLLYPGIGCPCRSGRSSGRVPAVDRAIDKGLGWLAKYFSAKEHPAVVPGGSAKLKGWLFYWLYSCERAGLASGIKYFGTHDWYAEGAQVIVRMQRSGGGWVKNNLTCWAICFLVKGRAPILFNKLQFDGEWNNHPRDMANLVKYVSKQKEQPLQWQIINFLAPVEEWHDAPILYITAESKLEFSAEEKAKLREFTDTGGTILFEASCGNKAAKDSWDRILKELWPEFELKRLSKEHALWTADQKIRGRLPILFGMSDGVRTFMIVSWHDMSCAWHRLSVIKRPILFDLGGNFYVYATDRRALRARLADKRVMNRTNYTAATIRTGSHAAVTAVRVKHKGDWYTGQSYSLVKRLASALAEWSEIKVSVGEAAAPSALKPAAGQMAWLTGRQGVGLADDEAEALKTYLTSGGFLLAEATMGDRRFDAEFRALAGRMGLKMRPVDKTDPLITGQLGDASGFNIGTVKFKFALRAARIGKLEPELYRLLLGDRLVGIYSPFDLSYCQTGMDAFDCRGYEAEDARAVLTNILLLVTTR